MQIHDLKKPARWYADLGALASGALLSLAFAPFNLYALAILCPALLLISWLWVSPLRAFLRGELFGIGFFGISISWVYVSLHVFGHASHFVSVLLTALLILFMALFPAVLGVLLTKFFPKNNLFKLLLIFPNLWVLLEWVRSWLLTGFPWLFLGYSQVATPLRGLAPVTGIYGISWAVAFSSSLLVVLFVFARKKLGLTLMIIVLFIGVWSLGFALTHIQWTQPIGPATKVSLVQGNIPTQIKWDEAHTIASLNLYEKLTYPLQDNQIIVWPEAAIAYPLNQAEGFINKLNDKLKSQNSALITGIPVDQDNRFYNGAIAIGNGTGIYLKQHLVPFGEYIPLRFLLEWFGNYLQIPMSDFSSGSHHQPLIIANGIPVATYICYEIAFPELVLRSLPEGQLLITLSDDSWFGKSFAAAQHVEIAQMRALETGRYLLMSTNDAITAIINPQGKVIAFAPLYQVAVLTGTIHAMIGSTPWMKMGSYPILLIMLMLIIVGFIQKK